MRKDKYGREVPETPEEIARMREEIAACEARGLVLGAGGLPPADRDVLSRVFGLAEAPDERSDDLVRPIRELTFSIATEAPELAAVISAFQDNGVKFSTHKQGTVVTLIIK